MHLNSTANCFAFGRNNRENASRTFFTNLRSQRISKMRLNCTANRFVFGRSNREIAPRTFSVKLADRELPKCVWTSREIPSFLDANILKMRPGLFFNLQDENLQNTSGLHGKQLRFCTQKSWKCAQNIFCKLWRRLTQKMYLNFTEKQLCFETQKSGNCAQNFFINFASEEFPKCAWTFYVVTWERLQSWKYVAYIF